jgi:protocatechuate 4,5-dioxygenase alpha chain
MDGAPQIPRTMLFDGEVARRGYALNKMCFSLNAEQNRAAFLRDESSYMDAYGLTAEQRRAVEQRDVLAMLDAGGNVYYLAKLAGALGLGVQDIGAQQTGVSVAEFKRRLVAAAG